MGILAALAGAVPATAMTQAPQPDPAAPSLRIERASLQQAGGDLRLRLRFSRTVAVGQIDPARARFVCLVLGSSSQRQRRVCVSRKHGGLIARLAMLDGDGTIAGPTRVLRRARIAVADDELTLRVPAASLRISLGKPVAWRAVITWYDGGPCERTPGPARCTQFVPASRTATLETRRTRPAFARAGHLRLLATGDSMIQIVDSFLVQRLGARRGASVRSDARISTGISKAFDLDWVRRAREQARSVHPDVTAIAIGANDGFPMKTPSGASVACCGGGWVAEYARRVESMMRSYARGGRSYVYWMTLPLTRLAARRTGSTTRHVRTYVTFRGRTVNARQDDGIHLSTAGASIAATLLIDRLRADRALPRRR